MHQKVYEMFKQYNISITSLSLLPVENHRIKHIYVKVNFIRNYLLDKCFNLLYVNTKLNLADAFTKPQTKDQLDKF